MTSRLFERGVPGWAGLLSLLVLVAGGCAAWPDGSNIVPDVKPMRKDRAAQAVREYEKHRDDAQYRAAWSAWNQGDSETCGELLDKLLARSPQHHTARLLKVQVLLLDNDLAAARLMVDKLSEDFANDPEVWHTRGLVYEAHDEKEQAAKSYRRAIELDPRNKAYTTSLNLVDGQLASAGEARTQAAAAQSAAAAA